MTTANALAFVRLAFLAQKPYIPYILYILYSVHTLHTLLYIQYTVAFALNETGLVLYVCGDSDYLCLSV